MLGRFVGGQVDPHMDHLEGGQKTRRGAILKREIEDDRPEGLADLAGVKGVVRWHARIVVGRFGGRREPEGVAGLHGKDLLGLRRLRPMAFVDHEEHPLRPAGLLHKCRELEPGGIENADQDPGIREQPGLLAASHQRDRRRRHVAAEQLALPLHHERDRGDNDHDPQVWLFLILEGLHGSQGEERLPAAGGHLHGPPAPLLLEPDGQAFLLPGVEGDLLRNELPARRDFDWESGRRRRFFVVALFVVVARQIRWIGGGNGLLGEPLGHLPPRQELEKLEAVFGSENGVGWEGVAHRVPFTPGGGCRCYATGWVMIRRRPHAAEMG